MTSKVTTQWIQPPKKPGEPYLVWIDCEMTGLNPDKDKIIEIAVIVTDNDLNIVEKGPEVVINQSRNVMNSMGSWCKTNHQRTGLTDAVLKSTITTKMAESTVLQFIQKHFPKPRTALLAGNSVHADREFLRHDMPQVHNHLHYRIVDVSGIAELCRQWRPDVATRTPIKKKNHRALDDIIESIDELRHFQKHFFAVSDRVKTCDEHQGSVTVESEKKEGK